MRYPEIEVIVRIGTMDIEIEAWADTGFESGIAIPASMEHDILAEAGSSVVQVADGHSLSALRGQAKSKSATRCFLAT